MSLIQKTRQTLLVLLALALLLGTPIHAQESAGGATFTSSCAQCHTGGVKGFLSGAPNINKPHSWSKHLGNGTDQDMQNALLNSVRDHKSRGGCSNCTEQEIKDVVTFLQSRLR